eukprot:3510592-Rhodomonas_salina.2
MPGTDPAYAMLLSYAVSGTELAYGATQPMFEFESRGGMSLRYASTPIRCDATCVLRNVRYWPRLAATRCPVLTMAMLLRGVQF